MAVGQQEDDPDSMLAFYRRMLAWRRARPALAKGSFAIGQTSDSAISYVRADGAEAIFCAFNLGPEPATVALPEGDWLAIEGSGFAGRIVGRTAELPPHEALFAEWAENSR
jgi:alpha-glucosidase